MPSGPKRAPTRKVVAVSKGAPTIAASLFSRSRTFGNRMKVRTPLKRGVSNELAGRSASYTSSLLRRGTQSLPTDLTL